MTASTSTCPAASQGRRRELQAGAEGAACARAVGREGCRAGTLKGSTATPTAERECLDRAGRRSREPPRQTVSMLWPSLKDGLHLLRTVFIS